MSQGGGVATWREGGTSARLCGVLVRMLRWLAVALRSAACWPAVKKHKCSSRQGSRASAGRNAACLLTLLAVARGGAICCWFAVSFCVQVARGNKSRLMGQGGGCFLLNQPFFFPNQGMWRERGRGTEYIHIFKCLHRDTFMQGFDL